MKVTVIGEDVKRKGWPNRHALHRPFSLSK
jgi:hypothetical protein